VKPLHAGLAAKNGVLAARLAHLGMTASDHALDGPQGFLAAMCSERPTCDAEIADLGSRWEIVETGITVKLYPSCAGTHPTLDVLLDLRRRERFTADDVERIDVHVDSIVPTILIHERPSNGLEAKFSLPFCAASAVVHGRVGIDTFEPPGLNDARVRALMPRVSMQVDSALDGIAEPLTQARVQVTLRDGRTFVERANGARGYPARPATAAELRAKFASCASRAIPKDAAERAVALLDRFADLPDITELTGVLAREGRGQRAEDTGN
jgi:2-methylcitrate dehydratase PrpD